MFYVAAAVIGGIAVVYFSLRAVYRIWFHPLSAFPGPRAAAVSRLWQARIMQHDFPEREFARLHREYDSQALRIGPNELHITDPSKYTTIYSQTHPFGKDPEFYATFAAIPHTLPTELDHDAHRYKRRLVNPLFSKAGVERLSPVFLEKISHMSDKIQRLHKEGAGSINVSDMFRCLMLDIISEFAFGFSLNVMDETPGHFRVPYLDAFDKAIASFRTLQFNPIFRAVAANIPLKLAGRLDEAMAKAAELEDTAKRAVSQYMQQKGASESKHPLIFDYLSGKMPEKDLPKESLVFLVAGGDTTAFTLACSLHYILSNPAIEQKLVQELDKAMGQLEQWPSLRELEQVSYLDAVVKESLRVAMPAPGALPRVVPSSPSPALVVDGKPIPPGTVVGMSAYTMHTDTSIWGPDAQVFRPERWLHGDDKEMSSHLEAHLVTFSKGARQCVARVMATAEITMTLAWLFSKWKMTLRTRELKIKDYFNAQIMEPGVLVDFEPRKAGDRSS